MSNDNSGVQVAIRIRKLITREVKANESIKWHVHDESIWETGRKDSPYTFDKILDGDIGNEQTYDEIAKSLVISAMEGINATIFAYGQTSSGKTHTMMGNKQDEGIIPRAVNEIFDYCSEHTEDRSFLLRVSYMEIYNETITDLLHPEKKEKLRVRENVRGMVYVKDLVEVLVTSAEEIYSYLESGELSRHFAATNMNERSSRSHTIFRLVVESTEKGTEMEVEGQSRTVRVSQLNLVDLAGSERAKATGAEGIRLKEGSHINTSLMVLSKVIAKLSEPGSDNVIPFRESKLTRILQSSLGGNAKTCVICTMTPAAVEESHSTLRFAKSAKLMKNKPIINEIMNDKAIISKYEKRIRTLERELEEKNQLESHIKLKDNEIRTLKGQLVGSAGDPTTPLKNLNNLSRRRETFFQGPTGLVASPRNIVSIPRTSDLDRKSDVSRRLFQLPSTVSDRGRSDEVVELQEEVSGLTSKLKAEYQKSVRLKHDLKELESLCTEMGDRMQDHIDEQQEKLDQQEVQILELSEKNTANTILIDELKPVLIAAEQERTEFLNQIKDKDFRLSRAEERNRSILAEAEEQRLELEERLSQLTSSDQLLTSPSKKRKSINATSVSDNYNEEAEKLRDEVNIKCQYITQLNQLLEDSASEAELKLSAVQDNFYKESESARQARHTIDLEHEARIKDLEEKINSLETSSVQKNSEFQQLQCLVQEHHDLVDLATQQEMNDLKVAIEDSNNERSTVKDQFDGLNSDYSTLLLKLQQTSEELETLRVETRHESGNAECNQNIVTQLEELKQQLIEKEKGMAVLQQSLPDFNEMHEMLEQKDGMIANLRSGLEMAFLKKDESEQVQQELTEKIAELMQSVENKCTELNEAEAKLIHLHLESVDATLNLEQRAAENAEVAKMNSSLVDENEKLAKSAEHCESCNRQSDDIVHLTEKNAKLTDESKQVQQELTEKIAELMQSVENKCTELNEAEAKLIHLHLESVDAALNLEQRAAENAEVAKMNSSLVDENEKLAKSAEHCESCNRQSDDIVNLTEENTKLAERITLLSKNNLSKHVMVNCSSNQTYDTVSLQETHFKVGELEDEAKILRGNCIQISDENCTLQEKNKDLEEKILLFSQELNELKSSKECDERNELKFAALAQENEYLKVEKKSVTEEVTELTKDASNIMGRHNEETKNFEDQLLLVEKENSRISIVLSELTEENARLNLENSELSEKLIQFQILQSQILIDENTCHKKEQQLTTLEDKLSCLQGELSNSQSALIKVQSELDEAIKNTYHLEENYATVVESLNSQISEAECEQTGLSTALLKKTEETVILSQTNSELSKKLANFEFSEIDDSNLKEEINSLKEQAVALKEEISSLQVERTNMNSFLESKENELDQAVTNASQIANSNNAEVDNLNDQISSAKHEHSELSLIIAKLTEKNYNMSKEISKLSNKVSNSEELSEKARLLTEVLQLTEENDKIKIVNSGLLQKISISDEVSSQINLVMKDTPAQTDSPEEDTTNNKLNNQLNGINSLENKIKSLEIELNSKDKECGDLRKMYVDISKISKDEFEILEEKSLLEDEVLALKSQCASKEGDIKDIIVRINLLTETIAENESQLRLKTSKIVSIESEYEDKLVTSEKRCTDLSQRLTQEVRAKNTLRDDCDELMSKLQKKERAFEEKDEDSHNISQLQEIISARDKEVDEKVGELKECVKHIEVCELDRKDLRHKVSLQCEQIKVLETDLFSLTTQRDASLVQVSDLQSRVKELTVCNAQTEIAAQEVIEQRSEIMTIISALTIEKENSSSLLSETEELKRRISTTDAERDCHVQALSQLHLKLEEVTQLHANITSDLKNKDALLIQYQSQVSLAATERDIHDRAMFDVTSKLEEQTQLYTQLLSDLEKKDSLAIQYQSMSKHLVETQINLENESKELSKALKQVNELKSFNAQFVSQKQTLENQIEELNSAILEYKDMKSSYIQLKSSFDSLTHKINLVEVAKSEAEREICENRKYFECTANEEKAKYGQLEQKYRQLEEQLNLQIESLKQEKLSITVKLQDQVALLKSDCSQLNEQNKEYTKKLAATIKTVSHLTTKEEKDSDKLKEVSTKFKRLEIEKEKEMKDYLALYSQHQALQDETDAIETKYDKLDKNFNIQKASLEKEIIRRKYVEDLAKVAPRSYKPVRLEEFMKELETDHTDYLNRIKNTYKDAGLVCQVCDKQRKIDPKSPRYIRRDGRELDNQNGASQAGASRDGTGREEGNRDNATVSRQNVEERHKNEISPVPDAAAPNIENIKPQQDDKTENKIFEDIKLDTASTGRKIPLMKPKKKEEDECNQQ